MAVSEQSASQLFTGARSVMPGGVSASMRLNPYLERPLYVERGEGAYLYDPSGTRYIDYNTSNGAALLGHNHPGVRDAVIPAIAAGIITAAETGYHRQLAETLCEIIPAAERVRFSTVGTEVTIVALRIARDATGRTKYLKFDGHFHGLSEPWLYRRADPTGTNPAIVPSSGGVPVSGGDDVIMIPFNNVDAFETAMHVHGDDLACVICEPIHYNAGCIVPEPGFLELLRERTREHGAILIFDEVLSGFRTNVGGVQAEFGVTPDLTTHAKALANGMPLSALSGRADLMEHTLPTGTVAHSGTYSGFLASILAAIATLDILRQPGIYDRVNASGATFYHDLQAVFDRTGVPVRVQGRGARFGLYFGRTEPVRTWSDALGHDHVLHAKFVRGCFDRGIYFHAYTRAGAPGHAGFTLAHSEEDFAETLAVAEDVCRKIARRGNSG
ncbi:MAG TPA: aspartate aminotransferase family protein [Thermomicrobiales bacterium]|nr:aspartate aminotransferase family protein [Thermomicrobiales bacterium]